MNNQIVREAMKKHSLKQWQVAELLNVCEWTMSRMMRNELPEDKQKEIVSLIEAKKK